ncbi:MAG: hypothetical protein OEW77_13365 [Gemmatimonadota bacterium]|nr:hypothetical protein [Gemmatimonadota bacterium]
MTAATGADTTGADTTGADTTGADTIADTIAQLDALRFEHKRRLIAVLAALFILPIIVFAAIDVRLIGRDDPRLLGLVVIRVLALALAGGLAYGLLRLRDERLFGRIALVIGFLIVGLLLAVHLLRPPALLTPYFFETIMIVALYAGLPSRWQLQLIPALLIAAYGIVLLFTWHRDASVVERAAIITALLLANGVGIVVAWHWRWYEQREEALLARETESQEALMRTTAELRTLQKILPICSHCRQVRDGAGAWAELEAYVHTHSDTRFSHGICPDCMAKHFPDEATAPER